MTGHHAKSGGEVSLRMVMPHMHHEYALHNGHADLLREGTDGTVGRRRAGHSRRAAVRP